MGGTVQSGQDLIDAGAGEDFEEVQKYLAFSCVGRWTGAGSALRKETEEGKGCDWTLGGLFQLHDFVVIDEDGKEHPHFMPALRPEEEKEREESQFLISS